jgi:hypothetical protein
VPLVGETQYGQGAKHSPDTFSVPALIYLGFLGSTITSGAVAGPLTDVAATLADVMQEYKTAASKRLKSLETEFNQKLPSGVSRIIYLDCDIVATWFGMVDGPRQWKKPLTTTRQPEPITAMTRRRSHGSLRLLSKTGSFRFRVSAVLVWWHGVGSIGHDMRL